MSIGYNDIVSYCSTIALGPTFELTYYVIFFHQFFSRRKYSYLELHKKNLMLEAKQLTQVPHQNPLPLGYEKMLHFLVFFNFKFMEMTK